MRSTLLAATLLAASISVAGAQTVPALTYAQPLPASGVLAVQQRLQQQGAYAGRVDGIWGRDSQTALERYQRSHGLQTTGTINQATAATLGLTSEQMLAVVPAAPAAVIAVPTAVVPAIAAPAAPLSRSSVLLIQNRLRELNYYPGVPDGVFGGDTQQAIERFQQGRGLQANGQLNPATVSALGLDPNALLLGR